MKLSLKQIFAAGTLLVASTAAFADASIPTGYQNSSTAPSGYTTDTDTDGGLVFYLYDSTGGDGTSTYSLSYYLGLDLSQVMSSSMDDSGLTLTWHIDVSSATSYGLTNLVWGVTAGDNGAGSVSGSTSMVVTVDDGSVTSMSNNALSNAAANIDNAYDGANENANALDINTTPYNSRDAFSTLNNNMAILDFDWTASATDSSDTLSMYYYLQSGGLLNGDDAATATKYAGVWSFDTSTGTLTYTVAAVPLPAALWLLLSGIAGFGVIGRRRQV